MRLARYVIVERPCCLLAILRLGVLLELTGTCLRSRSLPIVLLISLVDLLLGARSRGLKGGLSAGGYIP